MKQNSKYMKESFLADKNYTHFAINKNTNKVLEAWNFKGIPSWELKQDKNHYFLMDLKDRDFPFKLSDIKILTRKAMLQKGIDFNKSENWYKGEEVPQQPDMSQADASGDDYEKASREVQYGMKQPFNENKSFKQKNKTMKRLKFKKEFNGISNAIKLIPEHYKVDNNEFQMTDGNENYTIRWEGAVNEGKAVILQASNKTMVNEDIQRMKHLFNYKSQETLGLVKGKERINEDKAFTEIWNKTKKIMEGEDIEDESASEGEWDDVVKHAPEAKKHIEGSTSTDKGTQAPKPKEGHWEKAEVGHAPEAKKHVQGSASTEKGTKAPKPKEGDWEKAKKGQAPEAKEHVKESAKPKKK